MFLFGVHLAKIDIQCFMGSELEPFPKRCSGLGCFFPLTVLVQMGTCKKFARVRFAAWTSAGSRIVVEVVVISELTILFHCCSMLPVRVEPIP